MKRFVLEALTLILAAVVCAAVANMLASNERRLRLRAADPALPRRTVARTSAAPAPVSAVVPSAPATQATENLSPVREVATKPAPAPSAPVARPVAEKKIVESPRTFAPHPDRAYVEITGEDAEYLHGRGTTFFDARRSEVFAAGRIARAESIPVWEADVDERIKGVYERNLSENAPIVVYCSGGNCEDSHMLAEKLWNIGLNNVLVYKDGYPDWVKRGGAIETGVAR